MVAMVNSVGGRRLGHGLGLGLSRSEGWSSVRWWGAHFSPPWRQPPYKKEKKQAEQATGWTPGRRWASGLPPPAGWPFLFFFFCKRKEREEMEFEGFLKVRKI